MKDTNLYISLVYFLFVSGIFANVLVERSRGTTVHLWHFSVFSGLISTLTYFLSAAITPFFVLIANTFLFISILSMTLLFVSWTRKVKSTEIRVSIIASVIYAITIGLLLTEFGSYISRSVFVTTSILILLIVNFYALYKCREKDKSVQLKIIYWLNTLLIIIAIIRLYATISLGSSIDYYYNEGKQLLACRVVFFSGLLLLYVSISNYYYQHTLEDQKLLLNKLEERDLKLNISISEKNYLSNLIAEREKMLSLLSSSNKLISSSAISATIAHEINQPLAAIKLNAELLKLNILNKGDRLSLVKPIDSIIEDNERINQTIKSLRNLFLDKSEKSSKVNIDKLIKSLISTLRINFSKTKIKFDLNLRSEGFVLIDLAEFNQAFINILRNAIDELQSLKQTNKLIKISTYDANDSFHLNIADNGRGIPASLKGTIFELFKSGKKEGMGLGLWLTKYIVLRHKGKISFRSRSGAGAEFMIEFPLVKL